MDHIKVLMFSKKQNIFCDYAEVILKSYFKSNEYISVRGNVGDSMDDEWYSYQPDYIISFVSPWIIPGTLLDTAGTAAINFHPGSPEYPGIGCYNFALYENSEKYGVTVHHMKEKVDTGNIIMTSYFDISPFETIESLKLKSMNHLLHCYEKILSCIAHDIPMPVSEEIWKRKPFTRKQMLALFEIDPQKHDEAEMERRIRAAAYPGNTGAYVTVAGHQFYLPYEDRKSIVD